GFAGVWFTPCDRHRTLTQPGGQCLAAATSLCCLRLASPFSKSPPTILSMFMNRHMNLDMKFIGPSIAQVTLVPAPSGLRLKLATSVAWNGLRNSSLIATRDDGCASVSVIRPCPTLSMAETQA